MIEKHVSRWAALVLVGASAAYLAVAPAGAADFYAGKTITLVVGGDVAGGYDIYARAIARHLGRKIPGNPAVIVQNMPGAGSNKAAEYIYSVAPKDGSVFGAVFPGAIIGPLLDERTQPRFDPTKFNYIGTANSGTRVCATYESSKIKTYEDARKSKTILGASATGGSTSDYAYMLNRLTGTRFEVVSGYKGTAEIGLAMERGEVDGLCGFDWTSLKSQKPEWVKNRKINILVQAAIEPEPELTAMAVPQIWSYMGAEERKVAELVVSQQIFGRPYIAPPGMPADRVAILREAFMVTIRDKEFLADAERAKIDVTPKSGEEVQAVVQRLYASSRELVERAKKAINPPG